MTQQSSESRPQHIAPVEIDKRMDAIPISGFHRRALAILSAGEFFDMYDLYLVGTISAALLASKFFTPVQATAYTFANFGGMFLGCIALGWLTDRFGRKTLFRFNLLWYSLFTLVGAFSPDANFLIVTKALAGLGMGAQFILVDTYLSELIPRHGRGRYISLAYGLAFLAIPLETVLGRYLVPTNAGIEGWRWLMIIGAVGALVSWPAQQLLPESPRWLASRGRVDEAARILKNIEAASRATLAKASSAVTDAVRAATATASTATKSVPVRDVFTGKYRGRMIAVCILGIMQAIGYFGFSSFVATFLLERGFSVVHALSFSIFVAICAPIGGFIGSYLADRIERKWTITALLIATGVFGLLFAYSSQTGLILLFACLVSLVTNWSSAIIHVYQAELFPTRIRATASGLAYSLSKASAAFAAIIIGALLFSGGVIAVWVFISISMIIGAISVVVTPRTTGVALDRLTDA